MTVKQLKMLLDNFGDDATLEAQIWAGEGMGDEHVRLYVESKTRTGDTKEFYILPESNWIVIE